MACSDDQQPNFKHFCRVCKKGFMCGRALGGHMRAHGVGDDFENLDDGDDTTADWDSSLVSSPETDEEDEDGYGRPVGGGGGARWCKRKRTSRVCASESEEDIALAKCLMALSNTRVDLMETEAQKRNSIYSPVFLSGFGKPPPTLDKAKGVVTTTTTPKALGGHRASHKNVKGCFATRNDQFDDTLADEDVITHNDFKNTSTYQTEREPSTGSIALAGRKSKVHKCTICSRVFASGQALGGHKRCHWLTSNYTSKNNYVGKLTFHEHIEQLHQRALAIPKELDLNLNLPVSGNNTTITRHEPHVPVNAKEDYKHQGNKSNGDQDGHIPSATIESIDGEGESKMKLAKLSELKDMNNTNGSSSTWLQVGIGSVTNVAPDP
ncbi:zinc finger protein ZAT9-like [Bidens hawaiensis]|uniref:zinc finger protein ZAT9-like n=1 Tax=Bidens hawaiensis TaxID=980011 RepID=UPI0040494679